MCSAQSCDNFEAMIAANAVIDMHNQVTCRQTLGLCQEVLGCALSARRSDEPVAEDILLGNDNHIRRFKALLQWPHGQMKSAFSNTARILHGDCADQTFIIKQALDTLTRALRIGGQHHRLFTHFCFDMVL